MKNTRIAIIGAGNMGSSLLAGLITAGLNPAFIWVSNPSLEKLERLQQTLGVHITQNNAEAAQHAEVIILAVKPNNTASVTKELAAILPQHHPLMISLAAGITTAQLEQWLGNTTAIVRCMPNSPSLIRAGVSGLYANSNTTDIQRDLAESMLRAVGTIVWLDHEKQMDALTALSGSGPAYFFLVMEALQEAGEKMGLPPETARLLTLQTALGASRMALESDNALSELRRKVTSKGGTTEAAINVFEKRNLREIFTDALQAAKTRSEELS